MCVLRAVRIAATEEVVDTGGGRGASGPCEDIREPMEINVFMPPMLSRRAKTYSA